MAKDTKLYIGDKEIKGVKENVVTYADGSTETFTEKQLTYMITKEQRDLTQLRDLLLLNVVPEMMDVLEAYNIRRGDLDAIIRTIVSSYNNTLDIAIGKAFWTYKEWSNPANFQDDIRVSDLKRVAGK